jgi:septal ring factor EnvC (AmiA/AmiB activator)
MKYDSELQAIVDELGCIAVPNVPADVGDIIDGWRKENDKLHDALERQQEVIAGLRNEIATKDKRIQTLLEANRELAGKVRR